MSGLRWVRPLSAMFFAVNLCATAAWSWADVYYVCPISELNVIGEQPPTSNESDSSRYRPGWRRQVMQPYASASDGEIYVTPDASPWPMSGTGGVETPLASVAIRLANAQEITGKVFLPTDDHSGMKSLEFKVAASEWSEEKAKDFLRAKLAYYEHLLRFEIPGSAWFRHQARETSKQLGLKVGEENVRQNRFVANEDSLARSYALVSGGRALSENLQLDRVLPQTAAELPTVSLDSLEGITVKPFDWKELLKEAKPSLDSLAAAIPADQYAIFMPSFEALVALADASGQQGELVLQAAEPRAENARVRERYERQLGIGLNQIARKLGPAVIRSVAITGADPYLRTGADLAVVFQPHEAAGLRDLLKAQIEMAVGAHAGVDTGSGEFEGVSYLSFRTPDRAVCSYLAIVGDAVVVTNSPAQLRQLIAVSQGKLESLASLDEYAYFRQRYALGESQEAGFLMLSDNTIRKWCGPRWRIATSRRTRAAALMAEMQAAQLDELVSKQVHEGSLHSDLASADMGEFTVNSRGVQSSEYGTLEFLTPILELEFDKVSQGEANLYQGWRDGYQRNWSNFFDPIAIQFRISAEKLGVDLTVMPLIEFSRYQQMVQISKGASLTPSSGDPHPESLLHMVLALNPESEFLDRQANMATTFTRVNPLEWLGPSAAFYVDNDPLWAGGAQLKTEKETEEFFRENAHRVPIAVHFEVGNSFQLIAFLTGLRAFIEQATPGMTVWETLQYREQPYVKVSSAEAAKNGNSWEKAAIYYRAGGKALTLTLNEDLLKRAIDRQVARDEEKAEKAAPTTKTLPWLGENFCVTADASLLKILNHMFGYTYHHQMQKLAWANLAILNEWHRRYPDVDPVALHKQFWHRELKCPGGGEYHWNDTWQTMESSVYGHPGEPKGTNSLPSTLQSFAAGNFGQTFEEHGLRARVELLRQPDQAVAE